MNNVLKITVAVSLLVMAFTLVWMNRFQYDHSGARLIRVNRFTGQGCYFGDGTWESKSVGFSRPNTAEDKWSKYEVGGNSDKKETNVIDAMKADSETLFGKSDSKNQCEQSPI